MLNTSGLTGALAALIHGRPPAHPDQLFLQIDDAAAPAAPAGIEPPWELSVAAQLILPVALFVVTVITIDFSRLSQYIVTLWPTNALILAAALRYERSLRNLVSILASGGVAIAAAGIVSGLTATSATILGTANCIEVGIVLGVLAAMRIGASNITRFPNLMIFMLVGGGIAPIGSDIIASMALSSAYKIPWRFVWLHLYPAHALGTVIVAPLLLGVTSNNWYQTRLEPRIGEACGVIFVVLAVCGSAAYFRPFVFLMVPAILFATLRFGLVGATMATLITAVIASAFVVTNVGESLLPRPQLADRILALQIMLAFTSLWSLPTAALLGERDRLLGDLSLANAQLKAEGERKSNLVTGLRRHLSIVEEKERLRLSYELHDQAGQGLIAAILQLNEVDPSVDEPARERLHLVRKRMEDLGKTLHRIAWELRPPAIDELGLKKALASYIADWSERCATEADFQCDDPDIDAIPGEIGTAVYRVVQEGLTNIVKHARQPSNVSVVIGRVNTALQVIVEDDGCGFDVAAFNTKDSGYRGLGLDGMRDRLMLLGGTLEIESTPGVGTALFARIALDRPDDATGAAA